MKTILFRADQDILKSVMTGAAGGFIQCVACQQEGIGRQREIVGQSLFVREESVRNKSAPV